MSSNVLEIVVDATAQLAERISRELKATEVFDKLVFIIDGVAGAPALAELLQRYQGQTNAVHNLVLCSLVSDQLDAVIKAILADDEIGKDELIVAFTIIRPAARLFASLFELYSDFENISIREATEFLSYWQRDSTCFGGSCEESKQSGLQICTLIDGICGGDWALNEYKSMTTRILLEIMKKDGLDHAEIKLLNLTRQDIESRRELSQLLYDGNEQRTQIKKDQLLQIDPIERKHSNAQQETSRAQMLQDAILELNNLIGLNGVKNEVQRLTDFLRVQEMRKQKGMKSSAQTLHFVFTGNPGTGKTTVARIVSKLLYGFGILSDCKLIETDRSGLVGGYTGQTPIKTNEIVGSAIDGVLFIDEAYSLTNSVHGDDYGQEAITTLLKRMEDHRDRLSVIVAGYTDEMRKFLRTNPGLESRFTRFIHFEDFDIEDLCRIFEKNCTDNEYIMSTRCLGYASLLFSIKHRLREDNFANARFVRNVFEETLSRHSQRIIASGLSADTTALRTIDYLDLPFAEHTGLDVRSVNLEPAVWQSECPGCKKAIRAKIDHIGQRAKCKHCNTGFTVPWTNLVPESVNVIPKEKTFKTSNLFDISEN